jgi:hypothetical protein
MKKEERLNSADVRVIDLSEPPEIHSTSPLGDYRHREEKKVNGGISITDRWREGDVLHLRQTSRTWGEEELGLVTYEHTMTRSHPAVIPFSWIRDKVIVQCDEYMRDPPWEDDDLYKHSFTSIRDWDDLPDDADLRKSKGFVYADGIAGIVKWECDFYEEDFAAWQRLGASKQVAAELVAAHRRRIVRQIIDWYKNGYEWWQAVCYIDLMGETFEARIGCIDDHTYAETEASDEVAEEVASSLVEFGFTVTRRSRERTSIVSRKEMKRDRLRHNLNMFNWRD